MTATEETTWAPGRGAVKTAMCQHIAIAAGNPEAAAAFYQGVFGLPEVRRVKESEAEGIVLTDGFVELGFYRFTEAYLQAHDQVPGRSYKPGFTGFHHLGFSTPDAPGLQQTLERQGRHHGGDAKPAGDAALNPQWVGTDQLLFALSDSPWTGGRSLGPDVARVRHMGIACQDPYSTMRFFHDTLGMRTTDRYMLYGGFADGFTGSDGNIQYALLRFSEPYQHAHDDSRGFEIGFAGVHHIGFFVTDLERTHALLGEHHCEENLTIREFLARNNEGDQYVIEEKYVGPDRTSFEVSGVDWNVRPRDGETGQER